jgi:hypothetical protein
VFQQAEAALVDYGSRSVPREKIKAELDVYKTLAEQEITDERCFSILVNVAFGVRIRGQRTY